MNVAPQDSTNPQRPLVEGLRSYSDQNVMVSGASVTTQPGRDLIRNGNYDGMNGRMVNTNSTGPSYNPYIAPQIPPRDYRGVASAGQSISRRSHSLGNGSEQAYIEAQRAATTMLQQQAEHARNEQVVRRRASAAIQYPVPTNVSHNHQVPLPPVPNYSRPNFPSSRSRISPTDNNLWNSEPSNEHSNGSEYDLPRWQPDAEVNDCPICGHAFSFFYRKHHCRKCGRVVCANCSPHRITIPRRYIVNAPSVHPVEVDLSGDTTRETDAAARLAADQLHLNLNGSEEVRLCNPCVPDPNPLPPQIYSATPNMMAGFNAARMHQTLSENPLLARRRSHHMGSVANSYSRHHNLQSNSMSRHRTAYQSQYNSLPAGSAMHYGSVPSPQSAYPPRHGPSRAHRHYGSMSVLPLSRQRSMFEELTTTDAPPEESPQRQILEEDECPICHEELPPKGEDGSETEREAHVATCIETHFSSSKPKDNPVDQRTTEALPEGRSTQAGVSISGSSTAGPSTRRRTTGMVTYNATEKDCIGEDGSTQECIICFEDFEAGIEMGRLECLCKFHKACIRSWWDTKGVGACPVHQGGLI